MRIKRIAKIAVFCTIFVLLFHHVYKVLSWKDTAGDYYSSMNSFYELEENLVDVLFLGSSHCYCSIHNAILWEDYGIGSFSLAISGQDLAGTYHCFVEALKTQKPQVVAVEMYGCVFEGYQYEGNLYRNTLPYKMSWNQYDVVNNLVKDGQKGDYLLKWPIIHTRYAELQRADFQKTPPVYIGYRSEFKSVPIGDIVPYQGAESLAITERNEEYLNKMIQLAQDEGVELLFFVAPYNAPEHEQQYYRYAQQLAETQGVPFLNLIDIWKELELDGNTDFIDWMHTNYYGAKKVTEYMGEYLKEQYMLSDRRGDARYELWEQDAKARKHELQNQTLKSIQDVRGYLDMAGSLEEYTVVVASAGEYLAEGIELYDFLQTMGIGEEFYTTDNVWIFEDRQLVYTSGEKNLLEHMELVNGDLLVSSSNGQKSVVINKQECIKTANGINIVVYDNLLGEVVDRIGFDAAQQYQVVR